MENPKFELNLIKNKLPPVDVERLFNWMREAGEDFVDYHFDVPIKDFIEYYKNKYPNTSEEFKVKLKGTSFLINKGGARVITFLDVMSVYEEMYSNKVDEKGNKIEEYELFYKDMVDYCNTHEELNKKLHEAVLRAEEIIN